MTPTRPLDTLLVFNLATDADDMVLSFTTTWINRLAAHVKALDVITMRAGRLEVAENVRVFSVGKEEGLTESQRTVEFYKLLTARLRERTRENGRGYDACFAHMMPLFAAMSAPILAPRRIPITLWYTHRQVTRTLQLAARVSHRIVTAVPDSFPIPTPKVRAIGHGIDSDFFAPKTAFDSIGATSPRAEIVQVARLSPIKHQATLIRAIASIPNSRALLIGDALGTEGAQYRRTLEQLARGAGVADRIVFAGAQSPDGVRAAFRTGTASVNLSPPGLFDKAALESMAVTTPTLVTSAAFDDLLGEYAPLLRVDTPDDVVALSARLREVIALPLEARKRIGRALRERVVAAHSLDRLIARLLSVMRTGEPDS
jgi:glycosyltransferase involved in cell wall biosynthesis